MANHSPRRRLPVQDAEPQKTALEKPPPESPYPRPPFRRLRAYAFDPLASNQLETLEINQVTLPVLWEENLQPGPIGEYLEVVDFDPADNCFYDPVNLNDSHVLAADGLSPSESNPQFHQQMVYAVAMTTIRHFELALGRKALWAHRRYDTTDSGKDQFVQRLRVYPHALREANAYYSRDKRALLFGYFPASDAAPGRNLPGGVVFTCLSHDIIAHETTHALLDGMHLRFIEPSNPDVLAFHEAFADIVALFQHFTFPDVLRHQIGLTRGDLGKQNLLGQLAQQFGEAIGKRGALRSAIGRFNPEKNEWEPIKPDPTAVLRTSEPHARGAILVAAVFDAFIAIYKRRIADLLRIGTGGTGVLPEGELHPDLVNRLAETAGTTARHILQICIRALDYCPPVDITFGEYLRALITSDVGLVKNDERAYRVSLIEAFRARGIYPPDVRSLAIDSLVWQGVNSFPTQAACMKENGMRQYLATALNSWDWSANRSTLFDESRSLAEYFHSWFTTLRDQVEELKDLEEITGLALGTNAPQTIRRGPDNFPLFKVHAVRPSRQSTPDGDVRTCLVVEITQNRRGYFDPKVQQAADRRALEGNKPADFIFRGGSTLVFDFDDGTPRYFIRKSICSQERLQLQRDFLTQKQTTSLRDSYFGPTSWNDARAEPFAMLHRDM